MQLTAGSQDVKNKLAAQIGRLLTHWRPPVVEVHRQESAVSPGTLIWEDWKVDPTLIVFLSDGQARIRGHEERPLYRQNLVPMPRERVAQARERGESLVFRAHPTALGLYLVDAEA